MPLTPNINDKNRKKILEQKAKDKAQGKSSLGGAEC